MCGDGSGARGIGRQSFRAAGGGRMGGGAAHLVPSCWESWSEKEGLGAGLSAPWGQMGWRRTEGGKADTRVSALMPGWHCPHQLKLPRVAPGGHRRGTLMGLGWV